MSNTAEIIHFRARSEREEQRVAQLEDGYMRLANELIDATMCSGLPETELCILMAVWRKTYGYSKKVDWISNEQFEEMIDKHFTHCSTAKNNLVRKKVLLQQGRKVGMNTNISEWETKNNGFCKTLAKPAKKTLATSAKGPLQKLLTTKDNITKDKKDSNSTPNGIECASAHQDEQESPKANVSQQDSKAPALSCEAVLAVYHEVLPEAKGVRLLSDKRRNQIRTFWKKASKMTRQLDGTPFTLDSWHQYLTYISENCRWMLEDRQDPRSGRVWHRKGLEYFLSDETYLLVREGAKDDR